MTTLDRAPIERSKWLADRLDSGAAAFPNIPEVRYFEPLLREAAQQVRDLATTALSLMGERERLLASLTDPDDSRRLMTVTAFRDMRKGLTGERDSALARIRVLEEALRHALEVAGVAMDRAGWSDEMRRCMRCRNTLALLNGEPAPADAPDPWCDAPCPRCGRCVCSHARSSESAPTEPPCSTHGYGCGLYEKTCRP